MDFVNMYEWYLSKSGRLTASIINSSSKNEFNFLGIFLNWVAMICYLDDFFN
jgi:hypothetical protein